MMYCSVREAYDNPVQKKLEEYQNNNSYQYDSDNNEITIQKVQNNQDQYNVENNKNQYNIDNHIVQHPVFAPSFFTAQGDYANQGPYYDETNNNLAGTHIDELKNGSIDSNSLGHDISDDIFTIDDSLSFLDNNSVGLTKRKLPKRLKMDQLLKPKRTHQYYIRKFVKMMIDESLDNSLDGSIYSSANYDVYNHMKSCKYCRTEANKRIKSYYSRDIKNGIEEFGNNLSNNFTIPKDILLGYDLKDIVIIIIIGIILIFILDLFVKIGRKTINLKNKSQLE